MTYWTEDRIRERLDGTFTRLEPDGRVRVVECPKDYMPKHQPGGRQLGEQVDNVQRWTPEEDVILLELRRRRFNMERIGEILKRSEYSVVHRWRLLKAQQA